VAGYGHKPLYYSGHQAGPVPVFTQDNWHIIMYPTPFYYRGGRWVGGKKMKKMKIRIGLDLQKVKGDGDTDKICGRIQFKKTSGK
jgi:hypothetical protein